MILKDFSLCHTLCTATARFYYIAVNNWGNKWSSKKVKTDATSLNMYESVLEMEQYSKTLRAKIIRKFGENVKFVCFLLIALFLTGCKNNIGADIVNNHFRIQASENVNGKLIDNFNYYLEDLKLIKEQPIKVVIKKATPFEEMIFRQNRGENTKAFCDTIMECEYVSNKSLVISRLNLETWQQLNSTLKNVTLISIGNVVEYRDIPFNESPMFNSLTSEEGSQHHYISRDYMTKIKFDDIIGSATKNNKIYLNVVVQNNDVSFCNLFYLISTSENELVFIPKVIFFD